MNYNNNSNNGHRDPRLQGGSNNYGRQFFPLLPQGSMMQQHNLPSSSNGTRSSVSPKQNGSSTTEKVLSVNPKTLAVVNNRDHSSLFIDFYRSFKSFPTKEFSTEVHENCIGALKFAFAHFKYVENNLRDQMETLRKTSAEPLIRNTHDQQMTDLRNTYDQQMNDLRVKLSERENKIRNFEAEEVAAKKELQEAKENATKMRIDAAKFRCEADKARNDLFTMTSEKNRLIIAVSEEIERHKKTQVKYNALDIKYGTLFKENGLMKEENNKLKQKIQDITKERDDIQGELEENIKSAKTMKADERDKEPTPAPTKKRLEPSAITKKNDDDAEAEEVETEPIPVAEKSGPSAVAENKMEEEDKSEPVPVVEKKRRGRISFAEKKKNEEDAKGGKSQPIPVIEKKRRGRPSGVAAKKKDKDEADENDLQPNSAVETKHTGESSVAEKDEEDVEKGESGSIPSVEKKRRGRPSTKKNDDKERADSECPTHHEKLQKSKKTTAAPQAQPRRSLRGKGSAAAINNSTNEAFEDENSAPPAKRRRSSGSN